MISWSYYGEQATVFLGGEGAVRFYRRCYCLAIPVACSPLISTEHQLDIVSTLGTGLMLWVNIPIMLGFGRETMLAYGAYRNRLRAGLF